MDFICIFFSLWWNFLYKVCFQTPIKRNKIKAPKLNWWVKLANPNVNQSQTSLSLPWAWHSSAPACFFFEQFVSTLTFSRRPQQLKWSLQYSITLYKKRNSKSPYLKKEQSLNVLMLSCLWITTNVHLHRIYSDDKLV